MDSMLAERISYVTLIARDWYRSLERDHRTHRWVLADAVVVAWADAERRAWERIGGIEDAISKALAAAKVCHELGERVPAECMEFVL